MKWFVESETVETGDNPEDFEVVLFVSRECGYDSSADRLPFEDESDAAAFGRQHAAWHTTDAAA